MDKLLSKNPRNGEILKEIPKTHTEDLPKIYERAARAQTAWGKVRPKLRAKKILQLREVLVRKAEEIASVISQENGKPEFEALAFEIMPSLELLTFFSGIAPGALKDKYIALRNPMLRYRQSIFTYVPLGTVAVIAPWNYPFFLAFGDVAVAVLTGNAVVFKPSEYTPWVGMKIQEIFDEAGFPDGLVQTCYGEGDLGAAIIDQRPAKIFFTGSVRTGKAIMKQASQYLTPVTLELGGKDAMIVLADADIDYATSAALWGGYTNSGQVCASVERLIVHERIAEDFAEELKRKLSLLSADTDLGVATMEKQKQIYQDHLDDAKAHGAEFISGGIMSQDKTRMLPTLVTGKEIEQTKVYNEETFGPVIAMTTFKTTQEAIQKANNSPYGLLASVITSDVSLGEEIARELQVGSVMVNEVVFSAGLPETPWGGMKDSGFGRKHSEIGLYEFVHLRHINKPKFGFLTFKSFWWFPYTPYQKQLFKVWVEMYHAGLFAKLLRLPHFLWCFIQFLKNEPRL
ncbi:MAG: aldehyde dehydrogenase family protein [Bdellovibrionales bacterium]|nr:aldehyde dehydrogenase family protein [Bdellovibrionales bacterium]